MEAKVEGKGTKILIAILIILILGAGAVLAYKIVQDKKMYKKYQITKIHQIYYKQQ